MVGDRSRDLDHGSRGRFAIGRSYRGAVPSLAGAAAAWSLSTGKLAPGELAGRSLLTPLHGPSIRLLLLLRKSGVRRAEKKRGNEKGWHPAKITPRSFLTSSLSLRFFSYKSGARRIDFRGKRM